MKCTGQTKKGMPCGFAVVKGTNRCKWHPEECEGEVFGANAPPPEKHDFSGYSTHEIYTYVFNVTGGRVKLDWNMPGETLIEKAQEALS